MQLQGTTFAVAVEQSLASYHDLLAASGRMSAEAEVGLFGELLVLSHLVSSAGAADALRAWRAESEEHDLVLPTEDVEIKTTTLEARRHWVGSLSQLTATPGRPLWMLSLQLTGGAASTAMRLPNLVSQLSESLPTDLLPAFQTRLERTDFRSQQPHDTFRLLRLRSTPACFLVEEGFPRLDVDMLLAGGAVVARIPQVTYMISIDGLAAHPDPPPVLAGLCGRKHHDTVG